MMSFMMEAAYIAIFFQIGSCGGWILAKSLDLCASSTHLTVWQFFNEGKMLEDKTFKVVERCQLYNDFRPLPTVICGFLSIT